MHELLESSLEIKGGIHVHVHVDTEIMHIEITGRTGEIYVHTGATYMCIVMKKPFIPTCTCYNVYIYPLEYFCNSMH